MNGFSWTRESIERARKLAGAGLSASQIATAMGLVSRSSVIGANHRHKLGLQVKVGQKTVKHDHGGGTAKRIRARLHAEQFGKSRPLPAAIPSSVEIIGGLAGEVIPERLECKWIDGEIGKGARYCAQHVHELTSWCPYHLNRIVNPNVRAAR